MEDPSKLAFTRRLRIWCADGFDYRMELARGEKNCYARLGTVFIPSAAVPLPGETPEQLKQRIAALRERHEYERRYFDGNLFVIPQKIFDQIAVVPAKP